MKKKTLAVFSLLLSFVFAASFFSVRDPRVRNVQGISCEHSLVNHYEAKEPTLVDEGLNHEYWVCCACHKKWKDNAYFNEVSYDSLLLRRKTVSSSLSHVSSDNFILENMAASSIEGADRSGLYLNDDHESFFIASDSKKDGLVSMVVPNIPSSVYKIAFSYKYYDLADEMYANGYHAFASNGEKTYELPFQNDNLWHDMELSVNDISSLTFYINRFFGELYLSDFQFVDAYSLDSVFASEENFTHYFDGGSYCLDSDKQKAVFADVGCIAIKKALIDQALNEGYTNFRLSAKSDSSSVADIYLNSPAYEKLYQGNEADIRVDLRQVSREAYDGLSLNFRDASYNNVASNVTISNLVFYKDDVVSSWNKRQNTYVCHEEAALVIDTCYSGNDSYVNTSEDWYSHFLEDTTINMYFSVSYIQQFANTRGVLWGKKGTAINDLPLGESSLLNQSYDSGDYFTFVLEKEGIVAINAYSESDYRALKAKERLAMALHDETTFSSYFLTGNIADETIFSATNTSVTYDSKILGLKSPLLEDMQEAGYTNIAFAFQAVPTDAATNGYFDRFVYTSDGLSAENAWKIVYEEYDAPSLQTSLSVDIDLSAAFGYEYSNELVINIRPRREGKEGIDGLQRISSLHFYDKNDMGKSVNVILISDDATRKCAVKVGDSFLLPSLDDAAKAYFSGWKSNSRLHLAEETIYPTEDVVFFASYEENLFSLKDDDYAIVYEDDSQSALWAANDLKKYIQKTLGVTANVVADADYSYSPGNKIISIGDTKALSAVSDVVIGDEFVEVSQIKEKLLLKDDAFAIASRKKGLYLFGNSGNALRFASSKFLEDQLNVSFFSADEEKADSIDDCVIKNGGRVYNPYFDYRTYLTVDAYGSSSQTKYDYNSHLYNDSDYAALSSLSSYDNAWIEGYYADKEGKSTLLNTAHNTFDQNGLGLVKLSTYPLADYPNMWYQFNNSVIDIHYTDGVTEDGKIDRSTAMTDTACEAVYDSLKAILTSYYSTHKHTEKAFLSVGQADTNECCSCDACLSSALKYNNSGLMIRFYNAIINELKEDEVLKDCDFKLVMFAYQYNLFSPIVHTMNVTESGIFTKNKTIDGYTYDEADAADASAIPDSDHLYVRVAPLVMDQYLGIEGDADYLLQRYNGRVYDETMNKWVVKGTTYGDRLGHYKASILFDDWGKVTSNLLSWYYDAAFSYGFATYTGGVTRIERFLDAAKKSGFQGTFIQGNYRDNVYVDTLLAAYVYKKLCWDDNSLSAIELRNEFIDNYFDAASAPYIKEYYAMMDGYYATAFSTSGYGNAFQNISSVSEEQLYQAKLKLDEALAATDDETVKGRIERLELTPMFMMAKLDEAWRVHFINVFNKYGGKYVTESDTLDTYSW